MPGDNFSRRVARAAAVGGGRTYRSQTPVVWYATLLAICLLGVALVGYSRYERVSQSAPAVAAGVPPTAASEWEAAAAVDVCGRLVPYALTPSVNPQTAYANIGNGVVDIEPQRAPVPKLFEGTHAVLSAFLSGEGVVLTGTSLSFPGKPVKQTTTSTSSTTSSTSSTSSTTTTSSATSTTKAKKATTSTSSTTTTVAPTKPGPAVTYRNGQRCGSRPAIVQVETWPSPTAKSGTVFTSKMGSVPLKNGELITVAFAPKGAPILKPPASAVRKVSQFKIINPAGAAPSTTATTQPQVSIPSSLVPPSTTPGSTTTPSTSGGNASSSTVTSST